MTIRIEVKAIEMDRNEEYPSRPLYGVKVQTETSEWLETYTKDELPIFIKGVKAGASMHGNYDVVVTGDEPR